MVTFTVAGIPQPTPVKNTDTGLVENGYKLTVVDSSSGARAVLEIPVSQYTADNVQTLADFYLGQQNDVLARFARRPSTQE